MLDKKQKNEREERARRRCTIILTLLNFAGLGGSNRVLPSTHHTPMSDEEEVDYGADSDAEAGGLAAGGACVKRAAGGGGGGGANAGAVGCARREGRVCVCVCARAWYMDGSTVSLMSTPRAMGEARR